MVRKDWLEDILSFLVFAIIVLDIFYLYRINSIYKGLYKIQIFIPLILVLAIRFLCIRRQADFIRKKSLLIILFILILIPIVVYFTKAKYTYDNGKDILRRELKLADLEFDRSEENYTIPMSDSKYVFMKNGEYYYSIRLGEGNRYFRMDPMTGLLKELPERFY